jgi:hypothetical protein
MENINPSVGDNKGKDVAPWWIKWVVIGLGGVGLWIKEIVADGTKNQREMYDKLYQQQNRLIEVNDRSNKVLEDALKIIQEQNRNKSNIISDADSTYYWRTDSAGNGGTNKKQPK